MDVREARALYEDRLRPDKGDSSFTRVYKLLLQTPPGELLLARVATAYEAPAQVRHEFYIPRNTTDVKIRFHIDWGRRSGQRARELGEQDGFEIWHLDVDDIVTPEEFQDLAKALFGKPRTGPDAVPHAVPTFNCNPKVVFGDKKRKKGGSETPSFASWASRALTPDWEDGPARRVAAEANAAMRAVLQDPETERLRHVAKVELAKKDMVEVLKRWQGLGMEVLEEAWHLAIVAGVIES